MPDLINSIFRIDPTEGLVKYVSNIKPYHSKIAEVLTEYVYKEDCKVTVTDRMSWAIDLSNDKKDPVRVCGYGTVWDSVNTISIQPVPIVQATGKTTLVVQPYVDPHNPTWLSINRNNSEIPITYGTPVFVETTGALPSSTPQIVPGYTYIIVPTQNNYIELHDASGPVVFNTSGTGEMRLVIEQQPTYSFLLDVPPQPSVQVTVISPASGQLAFVRTVPISSIEPLNNTIVVSNTIVPIVEVQAVKLSDPAAGYVSGNCVFVFRGNVTQYFQPSSTFVITNSTHNNGTYTVDPSRGYPFYDGYNTLVPILEPASLDGTGVYVVPVNQYLTPGTKIYLNGNTGVGANGAYTIVSAITHQQAITIITNESISVGATTSGTISVMLALNELPVWNYGAEVMFSTSSSLPSPLQPNVPYYFIPTQTPGIFNISTARFPKSNLDFVRMTWASGNVPITVTKTDSFYPGAYVKVTGSHQGLNDGNYTVRQMVHEPSGLTRVYVFEPVIQTTPMSLHYDGVMSFNIVGYDQPAYCPVVDADGLYVDAVINERLVIEITVDCSDVINSTVTETPPLGWGITPYDEESQYSNEDANTLAGTSVSSGTPGISSLHTIVPTGIDTQLFDVGNIDETIETLQQQNPY